MIYVMLNEINLTSNVHGRQYFITFVVQHTQCLEKRCHYSSRISWSIFIIFVPLETAVNT